MQIVALLVIGLSIGIIGGMIGIGGGILLIPALTELFHYEYRQAAGISLAVLAIPVTLPGVLQYLSQGIISKDDLWIAGCLALAFAVGTFAGGYLQSAVSAATLRLTLALLMIYVAVRLLVNTDSTVANTAAALGASVAGWVVYLSLRAVGRRCQPPPPLADLFQKKAQEARSDDYYI